MGGLLRAIFGGGGSKRRRAPARRSSRTTTRSRRAPTRDQQRAREQREKVARQRREQREREAAEKKRQKELDRQAAAWVRTDNARRAKEERQHERERRAEQNRRIRQARSAATVHGRYERARGELEKQGFLPHEIKEIFEGGEEEFNPGASLLLRLPLALDFLRGGHAHSRSNPSCGVCRMNPTSAEASSEFHGRPDLTRNGRVLVGDIEEIVYRAPSGSRRAGAPWRHVAGDTGGLGRNRGRARLLADPNSGSLTIDTRGSGVRFDNRRGIVG